MAQSSISVVAVHLLIHSAQRNITRATWQADSRHSAFQIMVLLSILMLPLDFSDLDTADIILQSSIGMWEVFRQVLVLRDAQSEATVAYLENGLTQNHQILQERPHRSGLQTHWM